MGQWGEVFPLAGHRMTAFPAAAQQITKNQVGADVARKQGNTVGRLQRAGGWQLRTVVDDDVCIPGGGVLQVHG